MTLPDFTHKIDAGLHLDPGITAGSTSFATVLWAAALLLAGWIANLFLAAQSWSFLVCLATATAVSAAIGRRFTPRRTAP